ncbi:HAD family hydrolase [Microbacteriaceae bacterium 4G12]
MRNYDVILFDLDGTITDPKEGIVNSVQYALNKMNITEQNMKKLELFIGPPLQDSFAEYYKMNEEDINLAINYYRENFKVKGMFENKLYDGMKSLLEKLKQQGKTIIIATSKPTVFAIQILDYFKISSYFDDVVGSNLDGTRTSKTEIIHYILNTYSQYSPKNFIMIGDRKHDIIGANNNHISSIGVTYGYGTFEELEGVAPSHIVHSIQELETLLTTKETLSPLS